MTKQHQKVNLGASFGDYRQHFFKIALWELRPMKTLFSYFWLYSPGDGELRFIDGMEINVKLERHKNMKQCNNSVTKCSTMKK